MLLTLIPVALSLCFAPCAVAPQGSSAMLRAPGTVAPQGSSATLHASGAVHPNSGGAPSGGTPEPTLMLLVAGSLVGYGALRTRLGKNAERKAAADLS